MKQSFDFKKQINRCCFTGFTVTQRYYSISTDENKVPRKYITQGIKGSNVKDIVAQFIISFKSIYPQLGVSVNLHRQDGSILFLYLTFISIFSQNELLSRFGLSTYKGTLVVPKFFLPLFQNLSPLNKGVDGNFEFIFSEFKSIYDYLKEFLDKDALTSILSDTGLLGSISHDRLLYLLTQPFKRIKDASNSEEIVNIICEYFTHFDFLLNKQYPRINMSQVYELAYVQDQTTRPFGARNFRRVGRMSDNIISITNSSDVNQNVGSFLTFILFVQEIFLVMGGLEINVTLHNPLPSDKVISTPDINCEYKVGLVSTLISSFKSETRFRVSNKSTDVTLRSNGNSQALLDNPNRGFSTFRGNFNTNLYLYKKNFGLIFFDTMEDLIDFRTRSENIKLVKKDV